MATVPASTLNRPVTEPVRRRLKRSHLLPWALASIGLAVYAGANAAPPQLSTGADLITDLMAAPEIRLRPPGERGDPFADFDLTETPHPVLTWFDRRNDLRGLPVLRGDACQLPKRKAQQFANNARLLRGVFGEVTRRLDVQESPLWFFAHRLASREPDLPVLTDENAALMLQLGQAEGERPRAWMIERLWRVKGPGASKVLAHRALYETDPKLRQAAVEALKGRPRREVRAALLAGFSHPWPPVADHAGAALVALRDLGAIPALFQKLDAPDPAAPFAEPGGGPLMVREMVKVHHARNCLLCHAPSHDASDPARAGVPDVDQPLPPSFSGQYSSPNPSQVVRTDVTYLRQDFSAALDIEDPGPWPKSQRFDFLVRTRSATAAEVARAAKPHPVPQREAARLALQWLTSRDLGDRSEEWEAGSRARMPWGRP